jgi:hypothetical protein
MGQVVRAMTMGLGFSLLAIAACSSREGATSGGTGGSSGGVTSGATGGSGGGSGGTSPDAASTNDRCKACTTSAECSTGFCNRVESNDLAKLLRQPTPARGWCSAPGDRGTCGCVVGYLTGTQVCVGTGCPTGNPVALCDNLSGVPFGSDAGVDGNPSGTFTVSPTTLALGDVPPGKTIESKIEVTATSNVVGLSFLATGNELSIGSATNCGSTLANLATCTIVVKFLGRVSGDVSGIGVTISASGGQIKTVPVTARVVTPAYISALPTSATLRSAPGAQSDPVTIRVANIGGLPAAALRVALTGDDASSFLIKADTCSPAALQPTSMCSVSLVYAPAYDARNDASAALAIWIEDATTPSATVALTGVLVAGDAGVSPVDAGVEPDSARLGVDVGGDAPEKQAPSLDASPGT